MKKISNIQELISSALFTWIVISLAVTLISAETIYTGESRTFNLSQAPDKCEFSGNTYNLDGINFRILGSQVIVTIDKNFKPDTIILRCFIGEEIIDNPVWYSFGGGSSSSKITPKENKTEEVEEKKETEADKIIILEKEKDYLIFYILGGIFGLIILIYLIREYVKNKNEEEAEEVEEANRLERD